MKLVDVSEKTQNTFFRCLHDELPEDPRVHSIRQRWYERNRKRGLRAKLLIIDDDQIGGLCQYLPIEHSPLVGTDLLAILCLWVHGYDHGVGNQQGRAYGRFILNAIEEDARAAGAKGIAAWGVDWEINWMPVSFFEHLGYSRVDQEEKVVVVWQPFSPDAEPPKLLRLANPPAKGVDKVQVTVAVNGWCIGCAKLFWAREAVAGLENMVDYTEIDSPDCSAILNVGRAGGIFLDGEPFRPYEPLLGSDELRTEIIRLYEQKAPPPPTVSERQSGRGGNAGG